MEANLIQIGDSVGVILPPAMLKAAALEGATRVSITLEQGTISLKSVEKLHPREGWAEQLKAAIAEYGNVEPEEDDWHAWQTIPNKFDQNEWTW